MVASRLHLFWGMLLGLSVSLAIVSGQSIGKLLVWGLLSSEIVGNLCIDACSEMHTCNPSCNVYVLYSIV